MKKYDLNVDYSEGRMSLKEFVEKLDNAKARFYMFGVPDYNNFGDQAIAHAEKLFFDKYYPEMDYIEITEPQTFEAIEELKDIIRNEDKIGYTGGGNIGSLYVNHEKARRKVFESFPDHKTLSFPQSVFFEENEHGKREQEKSQLAYNKNPNLTLVARESQTERLFKQIFEADVIYLPDIVLSLDRMDLPNEKREGILFILREDAEKITEDTLIDELAEYLENQLNYETKRTDTLHPDKIDDGADDSNREKLLLSEREELLNEKLEEIGSSKLVVTDRLHGMIFSVITKTPCLVFDNSYGKASSSYFDWLENLNYIVQTNEKEVPQLVELIKQLIDVTPNEFNLEKEFEPLKEWIEKN